MLFSDPDYGIFLLAVFFLYGLSRGTGNIGRVTQTARALLMFLLADVVYVLITKSPQQLWSPVSGPLIGLLSTSETAALPWPQYVVGAGMMVVSVLVGRRYGHKLDSAAGRQLTGASITAVVMILGLAVVAVLYWQPWYLRLDEISSQIASSGHLVMLFIMGVAIGASQMSRSRVLGRLLILFVVSALFYQGWAASKHGAYCYMLLVLLGTIILDFYLALGIDRAQSPTWRRALLIISLVSNLGILCLFKYADFFSIDVLGLDVEPLHLILPAGISFHTFQSMSYTVDVYRRQLPATPSPLQFASFVLFFPQLVAGPIVRAVDLMPQLAHLPPFDQTLATRGLFRIVIGLFKKIVIADPLGAVIVSRVFDNPSQFSSVEVAAGVVGFAFQLYADFSGYSDIAIGSAQVLGFELPENFRTPYRAGNLQEFWRRWHISLSTWLRDYLYISLGGDRKGAWLTYRNLLLTMLIGGLWHGAKWTYLVWGALHGGGLALTRWYQCRLQSSQSTLLVIAATLSWTGAGIAVLWWRSAALHNIPSWQLAGLAWLSLAPPWALATVLLSNAAARLSQRQPAELGGPMRGLSNRPPIAIQSLSPWSPAGLIKKQGALIAMLLAFGVCLYAMHSLHHDAWLPSVVMVWLVAVVVDAGSLVAQRWGWWLARIGSGLLVFGYVCLAWVFFRASSCHQAFAVLDRLSALEWDHANVTPTVQTVLLVAICAHLFPDRVLVRLRDAFCSAPSVVQGLVLAAAVMLLRVLAEPHFAPFFYNEF